MKLNVGQWIELPNDGACGDRHVGVVVADAPLVRLVGSCADGEWTWTEFYANELATLIARGAARFLCSELCSEPAGPKRTR